MFHEITGTPVAMLRYHGFVPKPYLAWGAKLLRNGVDGRDVAEATRAALSAGGKQPTSRARGSKVSARTAREVSG